MNHVQNSLPTNICASVESHSHGAMATTACSTIQRKSMQKNGTSAKLPQCHHTTSYHFFFVFISVHCPKDTKPLIQMLATQATTKLNTCRAKQILD